MIRYFEAQKCQFQFEVETGFPVLKNEDKTEVVKAWRELIAKKPGIFNGGVWSCHRIAENDTGITMGVNTTDYATYLWARSGRRIVPGAWTIGTGALIFDEDDNLILVQRTMKVATDPGKISVIGGVVDIETGIMEGDFVGMIRRQIQKEINEEIDLEEIKETEFLGVAIDAETLKVEFGFRVDAGGRINIKDKDESRELVRVKGEEIGRFIRKHRNELELSTRWHLEHWFEGNNS